MKRPALRIAYILVRSCANYQLAFVRLAHIRVDSVRHHHARKSRLDGFGNQCLQRVAFKRKIEASHLHNYRAVARRRNAHALGGDIAARCFHTLYRAIGTAADTRDSAILNDINTQSSCRTGIAPSDRVMTRRAATPLQRRTQYRMPRIWCDIQRRTISFGLFGREPFIIYAIQPVGVDMALKALHIMHIMREHHDATLGIHDVVIEFLTEAIPQLDRVIIKMRAFIIEIIGADDRGVASGIAAADPALFKYCDVGNPVFLREIICRAKTMPTSADDDRIISGLGCSVGPLFGPILMPA